jgi:hypothetical protein
LDLYLRNHVFLENEFEKNGLGNYPRI